VIECLYIKTKEREGTDLRIGHWRGRKNRGEHMTPLLIN
jgi:hypothetical protein